MKFARRTALAALLSIATATAQAALQPGDAAPPFALDAAQGGKTFRFELAQALAQGPVVLYFYPKSFTSGCTVEAHLFAEATPRFAALGATVVGVSADDVETQKRFSVEACRDKFAVAADADAKVIRAYNAQLVQRPSMADRISYVIGRDGRIAFAYRDANPEGHVAKTLEVVERLGKK